MALTFRTCEIIAAVGAKCRLMLIKGAMKGKGKIKIAASAIPPYVGLIDTDTSKKLCRFVCVGAGAIEVEIKKGICNSNFSIEAIFTAFPITRPRSGREIYQTKQNSQAQEGHGFPREAELWQIKTGLEHKNSRIFVGNTSFHG